MEEGSTPPPGLRLNAGTGELTGTVLQVGEFRHTVCVTDATQAQICVPFLVIAVANEGDTYSELPPARVSVEYQNLVAGPGEFAEFAYDPASGSLPPGMVLESTGRLYGIPRAPGGAWAFRARAKNFEGITVARPFLIRVLGPLAATTVLPNGFNATEYSSQLTVLGDRPPHVWTVRRGPLPPGYILSESGRINGICNLAGRYAFALRVSDPSGASQPSHRSTIGACTGSVNARNSRHFITEYFHASCAALRPLCSLTYAAHGSRGGASGAAQSHRR